MDARLEELVGTLLFEGYALYPYTPGATKNATPTPFGIVYPPAYVEGNAHAFDRVRLVGVVQAAGIATVTAEVRFLQPDGERHKACERRVDVEPRTLAELAEEAVEQEFGFDGLSGRMRIAARPLTVAAGEEAVWRVTLCVHNTTAVTEGLDRAAALSHSLLSTHPLVRVQSGRFTSPLERSDAAGTSINTFPVLATDDDDVLLGAAIMLPDHPQLAPESRGDLFDGTEIEEALLLHVLVLSDAEREQIAQQDPAVREMVQRAATATAVDVLALHGRTVLSDPASREGGA
jgi:hypothetical protein